MIIGLIVKPILIIKLVDYTWREVFSVFVPCLRVTLIAVIPSTIFFVTIPQTSAWILISEALIMMAFSLVVSYFGGLDKSMRERIRGFIVEQLHIEK